MKLHWFADLMNVTEEVTIHRPNVSTLLSSAFLHEFGFWSRVEGTKSRVEGNMSTVEGNMSRVLKNENKIIKIKIKKSKK